jgi:Terminase small subunit
MAGTPRKEKLAKILATATLEQKSKPLDEREKEFCKFYASGGLNGAESAKAAGYATDFKRVAERLLEKAYICETIRRFRKCRIEGDLAGLALDTLAELMRLSTPPVRLGAAKVVLDMASYSNQRPESQLQNKPLGEMSVSELEEFVQRGERALQGLKPLNVVEIQPD